MNGSSMDRKCTKLLEETSRTFLLPIMRLPEELKDAVGSAYLCLRAIDEIEDHPSLPPNTKMELLNGISAIFRSGDGNITSEHFSKLFSETTETLPEVTLSICDLADLAPAKVATNVHRITADMAMAMAGWVEKEWNIETEEDLDQYTFDVAGRVGLLLSDLWKWYDGTVCHENLSIGFGQTLQAVNIVRNRDEDLQRGADFFPTGWNKADLISYARRKMKCADEYMAALSSPTVYEFCILPLELARATLDTIEAGGEKLTRNDVKKIVAALYT